MNHQFHHSMTHNKTPPPKKSRDEKYSKWDSGDSKQAGCQLINLTSFALLLPPLLQNPASSAHPAAGVWLPCLCPGLVRCGGWSSMGSTAHAQSLAFRGDPAAAVGLHIGTRNFGPKRWFPMCSKATKTCPAHVEHNYFRISEHTNFSQYLLQRI